MITYQTSALDLDKRLKWKQLTDQCAGITYIPNRAQLDTNLAIGNHKENKKKIFLVTSANGTGKTTTIVNVLANIIWPGLNIYREVRDVQTDEQWGGFFDAPLYRQGWPQGWPKRGWIIGYKIGVQTIIDEIHTWWPKDSFAYKEYKDGQVNIARITTNTGWTLYFKTTNMEERAFESGNIGFIWCDEPPKQWQYNALLHRIRKGGMIILTATPVFKAGWFVDSVVEKIDLEVAERGWSDKWHNTVDLFSNSLEHAGEWDLGKFGIQKKGNLALEYVEFLIRNCDDDEAPARIYGQFISLSGLVYKTYDIKIHRRRLTWNEVREWYMYRMVIDPHDRLPPAITWTRIDPRGQRYTFREWPSVKDNQFAGKLFYQIKDAGKYTIRDFCEAIIEIEEEWRIPLSRIERIMDPNFAKTRISESGLEIHQAYSEASAAIYKEKGYPEGTEFSFITNVKDDIMTGHKAVRDLLARQNDGDVREIIDPDCKNADLSYRRYSWRDHKGDRGEWDSPSEALEGLHKHFMDVRRYDACLDFSYEPLEKSAYFDEGDYGETGSRGPGKPPPRPKGAEGV